MTSQSCLARFYSLQRGLRLAPRTAPRCALSCFGKRRSGLFTPPAGAAVKSARRPSRACLRRRAFSRKSSAKSFKQERLLTPGFCLARVYSLQGVLCPRPRTAPRCALSCFGKRRQLLFSLRRRDLNFILQSERAALICGDFIAKGARTTR